MYDWPRGDTRGQHLPDPTRYKSKGLNVNKIMAFAEPIQHKLQTQQTELLINCNLRRKSIFENFVTCCAIYCFLTFKTTVLLIIQQLRFLMLSEIDYQLRFYATCRWIDG